MSSRFGTLDLIGLALGQSGIGYGAGGQLRELGSARQVLLWMAKAGTYAYGKSEQRTAIVDGRLRKTYGHGKPLEACEVLLKDHHEGYVLRLKFIDLEGIGCLKNGLQERTALLPPADTPRTTAS